jgi:hypothetical protein
MNIQTEYRDMEPQDIMKTLQNRYLDKLKAYGRKKKTPEQVFDDIMDWYNQEYQSLAGEFDERMRCWMETEARHEEAFGSGFPSQQPRKSNKLRVALRDLEDTLERKIDRLKCRQPEWWEARNNPKEAVQDEEVESLLEELREALKRGISK